MIELEWRCLLDVRYAPDSDQILQRSEMSRCAKRSETIFTRSLTSPQSFKRRPDGLRACVRSLSSGGATRRPVGASRNDKQVRRVSRVRDACIVRLTRPLLRERFFR